MTNEIKTLILNVLGVSNIQKTGSKQIDESKRANFLRSLVSEGYTEESINKLFDVYLIMDPLFIKKDDRRYKDILKKS